MTRRRDPDTWTVMRSPERELADVLLELAAPLLERLGPAPSLEDARRALDLAVRFWNASVRASKFWGTPKPKELNELRRQMAGRQATPAEAALFDALTERRRTHAFDPRLVDSWTYDADDAGARHLACSVGLPDRVQLDVPPPIENRIAIAGKFLDEVQIAQGGHSRLSFPVTEHRAVVAADGTVTVHARMPSALQLFAEGRLTRVGGAPVELMVGGRQLGPMTLAELRCGGEHHRHDIAILVFRQASPSTVT